MELQSGKVWSLLLLCPTLGLCPGRTVRVGTWLCWGASGALGDPLSHGTWKLGAAGFGSSILEMGVSRFLASQRACEAAPWLLCHQVFSSGATITSLPLGTFSFPYFFFFFPSIKLIPQFDQVFVPNFVPGAGNIKSNRTRYFLLRL